VKIQTMSVVVGTSECNAHCPFCVSRQTPKHDLPITPNWRNFKIACKLADKAGATTILFTGKGEPTLHPELITEYLIAIKNSGCNFPFIELQTNGIQIGNGELTYSDAHFLDRWYKLGLTTIALSAVETGFANKKIYSDNYPEVEQTAKIIIDNGFSVRLSIMMMKTYICKPIDVLRVVDFCKANKIKQLTLRPIARVQDDTAITQWVNSHTLSDGELETIMAYIKRYGVPVLNLAHGAVVYDFMGQNLCLSNCLTTDTTDDSMRQIIFYPDGTISFNWKYTGAVLL